MKFGLTQKFECSYLPEQKEQLLVYVEEHQAVAAHYELLIESGFRRSGEQIYRPHCPNCTACQSIRIPVEHFKPSKSQKRVFNRNQDLLVEVSKQDKPEYFLLYEEYINQRHYEGSMYPATHQQYDSFINCNWSSPLFFEFYFEGELIGVAVTDELHLAFSALYTFFKPDLQKRSLGTFAILRQIEYAKQQNKQYLYLGYQVDACSKMNYKRNFYPHERFLSNKWYYFAKKGN